jgi:hypothetical protein
MPCKNRCRLARELAGLSLGQAARLLGITADDLRRVEVSDACYAGANQTNLADVYGVNLKWLSGFSPRRDYAAVDCIPGGRELPFHDRDVLAECLAARPCVPLTGAT